MSFYLLFLQIRFLQIFPYSNYFCKDCACTMLDTRYVQNFSSVWNLFQSFFYIWVNI